MHWSAWVCVGITIGVAYTTGIEITQRLILHEPLIYPEEAPRG